MLAMPVLGARVAVRVITAGTGSAAAGSFAVTGTAVATVVSAAVTLITLALLLAATSAKRRADLDAARNAGKTEEREDAKREISTLKQTHEVELHAANERADRAERDMEFYRDKYLSRIDRGEDGGPR